MWSLGTTECRVWIANCNVKVWKSTELKLHKIWFPLSDHNNNANGLSRSSEYLVTARKRSFGQGNKFTGMCLSTGRVLQFLGGSLQFFGGGVYNFLGVSNFLGGISNFGGSPIFFPKFLLGIRSKHAGGTHPTGMHSCFWGCVYIDTNVIRSYGVLSWFHSISRPHISYHEIKDGRFFRF